MPRGLHSGIWLRAPYLLTLVGLAVRASAASFEPRLVGLDPWHEHIVIGATESVELHTALRNHNHLAGDSQSAVEPHRAGNHTRVISIVDNVRAVLSALADSANEALLVPGIWLPAVAVLIALTALLDADSWSHHARISPPTPPPRAG